MRAKNQEISFEVAEKNETVTVTAKTPSLAEIAEPLPPLTPEQRKDLETVHPNLKAQIERSMRRRNQREQQRQQPPTTDNPKPTTTTSQLKPHHAEALKNAKSQQEREEIWMLIKADQRAKQRNETAKRITSPTNQKPKPKPFLTRANKKKQRPAPLTILQTIRFKTSAKYDILAAERIVSHICRRQGGKKTSSAKVALKASPTWPKHAESESTDSENSSLG